MCTIAVQIFTHFPITPRFFIVELDDKDWPQWLWGDKYNRIKIVYPYISDIYLGPSTFREVVWIRLDHLSDDNKAALINSLQS